MRNKSRFCLLFWNIPEVAVTHQLVVPLWPQGCRAQRERPPRLPPCCAPSVSPCPFFPGSSGLPRWLSVGSSDRLSLPPFLRCCLSLCLLTWTRSSRLFPPLVFSQEARPESCAEPSSEQTRPVVHPAKRRPGFFVASALSFRSFGIWDVDEGHYLEERRAGLGAVYILKTQALPRHHLSPGEQSGSLHTFQGSLRMLLPEPQPGGSLVGERPLIGCKPQVGGSPTP